MYIPREEKLYNDLLKLTGLGFFSDLHDPGNKVAVSAAIRVLDVKNYSIEEWTDAVLYITGQRRKFKASEDAAKYIIEYKY